MHPTGISMTGPLHSESFYAVKAWIGCIPLSCVSSHFCHYTPKSILLLASYSRPSLSFSLSPVCSYYFAGFCPGNLLFLVFFLSSSPSVSSIASHVLTYFAIYSPLLSSLFSFPRGLVQMSDQTKQHDAQRGAEFPLVHQSISNVPVCCV